MIIYDFESVLGFEMAPGLSSDLLLFLSDSVFSMDFEKTKEENKGSSDCYLTTEQYRRAEETEEERSPFTQRGSSGVATEEDIFSNQEEITDYEENDSFDTTTAMEISNTPVDPVYSLPSLPNSNLVPKSILKKRGENNAHNIVEESQHDATSALKQIIVQKKSPVSFENHLTAAITQVEKASQPAGGISIFSQNLTPVKEKSEEQKRIKLISFLQRQLALTRTADEIEIDDILPDDPEREAKVLCIHQNTFSKITKNYTSFLKKLDENPTLQNQVILHHSLQAIYDTLKILPSIPERSSTIETISQHIYPRLRDQYLLKLGQLREDSSLSSFSNDQLIHFADDSVTLLETAFKTFNPKKFIPLKAMASAFGKARTYPFMDKRSVPYELVRYQEEWSQDFQDVATIEIADQMVNVLKKIKDVFTVPPEEIEPTLCESRHLTASLLYSIVYKEQQWLFKELQDAMPSSEQYKVLKIYNDPTYEAAQLRSKECYNIAKQRSEEFANKKILISDLNEAKQMASDDLWNLAQKVVVISDHLVNLLTDRKKE